MEPLRRGWLLVRIDGDGIAVPSPVSRSMGLAPGAAVDREALLGRIATAHAEAAAADAGRYLGMAERTVAQLRGYLRRRGYLDAAVERAVEDAIRFRWVDDARFARAFVASRPGLGRSRILLELSRKGVARADAEAAAGGRTDAEAAEALVPMLRRRYGSLPAGVALRRAVSFLARRGFRGPEAYRAARTALDGIEDAQS